MPTMPCTCGCVSLSLFVTATRNRTVPNVVFFLLQWTLVPLFVVLHKARPDDTMVCHGLALAVRIDTFIFRFKLEGVPVCPLIIYNVICFVLMERCTMTGIFVLCFYF